MPKKLLLADDSVTIQRVIELTFADEDIDVIAVGDGKQAIARIESDKPDVVLADVGMPERDGYEVAAHIKGNPQLAHIPVLLLTGAFEPIDEARARSVGCDGVLVKPFEPQMVINRVKDLLAGRRPSNLWTSSPGPSGAAVTPAKLPAAARPAPPTGSAQPPAQPAQAQAQPAPAQAPPPQAQAHPVEPQAQPAQAQAQPAQGEEKRLESLDDYFDRLDAAFSTETPAQPPPPPAPVPSPPPAPPAQETAVDFGGWDIPLETKAKPEPSAPQPPSVATPPSHPFAAPPPAASGSALSPAAPMANAAAASPGAPPPAASPAAPALADAFAALLAAEQQLGPSASAPPLTAAATPAVSDDAIEQIVRRVLAQMTEETVRATVLDVAERLVKEEIERIKKQ